MSNLVSFLWFLILLQFGEKWTQGALENGFQKLNKVMFDSPIEMDYESLRKNHLRIYARNYPPVMAIIGNPKSKKVKFEGFTVEIADYIAQYLELTIEYVPENPSNVKKYGLANVIINALVNKDVDLSLHGMTPTPDRVKIIDMTSSVIYEDLKIMVKWPEEMDRWKEVARPFDVLVWLMIAVSSVALLGVMAFCTLVYYAMRFIKTASPENYHQQQHCFNSGLLIKSIGNSVMYIIGIIANQGQSVGTTYRLSLRIMIGLWLLMMVVVINAYSGTLTSRITVPKMKPIPQSLEELANMGEYRVTIKNNYLLANSFLNASSGTYKVLGDTLRQHPNHLFKEFSEALDLVLEHNGANIEGSMVVSFRIENDFKLHRKCRMTASHSLDYVQSFAAALAKDSPFTKIVNTLAQRAAETGLFEKWLKNHVPSMDRCKLENPKVDERPKPITLFYLSSAFVILGIGLGLSLFVFLVEKVVSNF